MSKAESNPPDNGFSQPFASPQKVVCLYAQEDVQFFRELQRHLYVWVREQRIVWLEISAGDAMGEAMEGHLRQADLILLLDSTDFIAADPVYRWMQIMLEEQKKRQISVVPILVRPSPSKETPYGELKALPDNQRPVSLWAQRDEAYQQIYQSLVLLLPAHKSSRSTTSVDPPIHLSEKLHTPSFQARSLSTDYVSRPLIFAKIKPAC